MPKRTFDATVPFQSIKGAARITGLSQGFIRAGCKDGTIPHIKCGQEYRVDVPRFLECLHAESVGKGFARD